MLTLRFDADAAATDAMRAAVRAAAGSPRITGAHLCVTDDAASGVRTTETKGRTDIQPPPTWFALIEATDADALSVVLSDATLTAAGAHGPFLRGLYRLEYQRSKTAFA
jgi:hypothetical protein